MAEVQKDCEFFKEATESKPSQCRVLRELVCRYKNCTFLKKCDILQSNEDMEEEE